MTKVGLPSDILVAKIKSSISKFDTSPTALSQLKTSGVADGVILAMVQAPSGASAPPVVQAAVNVPVVANASPPSTMPPTGDGKTRVFVTDSQSWEMRGSGSAGGNANGWGASSYTSGGARPQTAEIIKTLNQRCPELIVTNNLAKADFVLTLDHEGGKGYLQRHNKIAVFSRDGDDIFSGSTRELGSAVKDACQAMLRPNK